MSKASPFDLTGDEPDLQFRGKQLSHYDAILPRIGNSRCVMASWHSETTLICKINNGGGSARFAALTIGMQVGTVGRTS